MTVNFAFGAQGEGSDNTLPVGIPLLRGDSREVLPGEYEPVAGSGGFSLWAGSGCLVGYARATPGNDMEGVTARIYAGLLGATKGMNLYRIWNLVPRINGTAPGGLENYHAFCLGRSLAFESALGKDFPRSVPAASAVGTGEPELTVAFVAGVLPARHFENPSQVPAYEYPPEHGPRPPSFARATVIEAGSGIDAFVSGTSAVVGHQTVAPNDTPGQLECTIENLARISRACGLGERLGSGEHCRRAFRIYLRHAGDLGLVSRELGRRVLGPGDRACYLGAEICRSALNVEIEVAVRGADRI